MQMPNRRGPIIPNKTKETLAEYRRGFEDGYRYAAAKKKMLRRLVASIPKNLRRRSSGMPT